MTGMVSHGLTLAQRSQHRRPVHLRHHYVEQDDIRPSSRPAQRRRPAPGAPGSGQPHLDAWIELKRERRRSRGCRARRRRTAPAVHSRRQILWVERARLRGRRAGALAPARLGAARSSTWSSPPRDRWSRTRWSVSCAEKMSTGIGRPLASLRSGSSERPDPSPSARSRITRSGVRLARNAGGPRPGSRSTPPVAAGKRGGGDLAECHESSSTCRMVGRCNRAARQRRGDRAPQPDHVDGLLHPATTSRAAAPACSRPRSAWPDTTMMGSLRAGRRAQGLDQRQSMAIGQHQVEHQWPGRGCARRAPPAPGRAADRVDHEAVARGCGAAAAPRPDHFADQQPARAFAGRGALQRLGERIRRCGTPYPRRGRSRTTAGRRGAR